MPPLHTIDHTHRRGGGSPPAFLVRSNVKALLTFEYQKSMRLPYVMCENVSLV